MKRAPRKKAPGECKPVAALFCWWRKEPRKGWSITGYFRTRMEAERAMWADGAGIVLPRSETPHSLGLTNGRLV